MKLRKPCEHGLYEEHDYWLPALLMLCEGGRDDLVGEDIDALVNRHPFDELLERAWFILANASGGDWAKETTEWQEAAEHWRDCYHEYLRTLRRSVE